MMQRYVFAHRPMTTMLVMMMLAGRFDAMTRFIPDGHQINNKKYNNIMSNGNGSHERVLRWRCDTNDVCVCIDWWPRRSDDEYWISREWPRSILRIIRQMKCTRRSRSHFFFTSSLHLSRRCCDFDCDRCVFLFSSISILKCEKMPKDLLDSFRIFTFASCVSI